MGAAAGDGQDPGQHDAPLFGGMAVRACAGVGVRIISPNHEQVARVCPVVGG